MKEVKDTLEQVARDCYGRLVAYLAVQSHDITFAEDVLSEAFVGYMA